MTDALSIPGSIRIRSASPDPLDYRVEALQASGEWLPLRICGLTLTVSVDNLARATIVVEPSEVDVVAQLQVDQ